MTTSVTIELLRNLKPGHRMCYYHGNFRADIARSNQEGCSKYADLLHAVESEAIKLAAEGRIAISKVEKKKQIEMREKGSDGKIKIVTFPMTEYYAVGVQA